MNAPENITDRFFELYEKVDKKDPAQEDVKALRQLLEESPNLWKVAGNLFLMAGSILVDQLQTKVLIKESLLTGYHKIQDEMRLVGTNSALEQLLIEHVALCWLRLSITESMHALNMDYGKGLETQNVWDNRLNQCQMRYLKACESLARVRRIILKTPAIQINIAQEGGKQVNVLGKVKTR